MSRSDNTPSRSKPVMFNSGLFSTPTSSSDNNSGISSLGGFGDDVFSSVGNSPFSLAPAKPVSSLSAPDPLNKEPLPPPPPLKAASDKPRVPTASSLFSSVQSPPDSLFEGGGDNSLSYVPLDTPPHTQTAPPSQAPFIADKPDQQLQPGSRHGWNDPPFLSQYQGPPQGGVVTQDPVLGNGMPNEGEGLDSFQIQPLVRSSESQLPSSSLPPVPATAGTSAPPPGGPLGSNPYRLGGKRPMINTTPAYGQHVSSSTAPQLSGPPPLSSDPLYSSGAPPTHPQPRYAEAPPTSVSGGGVIGGGQASVAGVQSHWFYLKNNEKYWYPFNILESTKLDEAYLRCTADSSYRPVVQTDGGRYDVDVLNRVRSSVYWEETPSPVRRCTWFYRGESDQWYIPYPEEIADKLEEGFCSACAYGRWNTTVELSDGEVVVIHSPSSIVQYPPQHFQPLNHELDYTSKTVLRGFLERDKVDLGDDRSVDHVVFVVPGMGPFADARFNSFKSPVDSVDDFREVALLMLKTHKFGGQSITNGRTEFLPVHWYGSLCPEDLGTEEQIQSLTLPSVSRLRDFTNSALTNILFYSSPLHQQNVIDTVTSEMNKMLEIFRNRNPRFSGSVSVLGHSLGSVILFDILSHQNDVSSVSPPSELPTDNVVTSRSGSEEPSHEREEGEEAPPRLEEVLCNLGLDSLIATFTREQMDFDSFLLCSNEDLKELGLPMGPRKKLSSFIQEWNQRKQIEEERKTRLKEIKEQKQLEDQEKKRLQDYEQQLGTERIKYTRGVGGTGAPHVVYPKLNFNPSCVFLVGSPVGLFVTIKGVDDIGGEYQLPTCPSVYNIFHPYDPVAYRIEPLVVNPAPARAVLMPHHKGRKRFHLELYENLEKVGSSVKHHIVEGMRNMWNQLNELARAHSSVATPKEEEQEIAQSELSSQISEDVPDIQVPLGVLNGGHRMDYVLQETPIEKLNDYLFAFSSHLGYWHSEDTALFILKQVYRNLQDKQIQ